MKEQSNPKISLRSLVRSGRLGTIGLGSSREAVEAAFGAPPLWDGESVQSQARIWKYGAIEIYFEQHRVWMIFTDDLHSPLQMGTIPFDADGLSGQMSLQDVEMWLARNQIEAERQPWQWCAEGVRFKASSGVTLTLCAEEEAGRTRLISIALVS